MAAGRARGTLADAIYATTPDAAAAAGIEKDQALSELEQLRDRALEELRQHGAPLPTGMLAVLLGVATHRLQLALNPPLQRGEVHFSEHGWALPAPAERRPTFDDSQPRLDS